MDININIGNGARGLDSSMSQGGGLQSGISSGIQSINSISQSMTDSIVELMTDMLVKALFEKEGDGATFGQGTKKSDDNSNFLEQIAKFMDQNSSSYSGPHDATGDVRNWQDELKEDNYLDKNELSDFKSGLKDALMQLMSGGSMGNSTGASTSSPLSSQSFSPTNGSIGSGSQSMSPMQQQGFGMGGDFGKHMLTSSIDGLGVDKFVSDDTKMRSATDGAVGAGRFEFSDEDKDTARTIGKMMDMNPEVFGKAPRGGWVSRIENGKDFNEKEMGRFQAATDMLKDSIAGKSTGDSELDMDLRLTTGALMNDAMNKVAA
ncbi:hypothetical protein [Marinomonas balearica]|uniref:HrpZ protein n=1 Tax=Marinomonas balearica TaxID=491947 RepID=A0A4R6M4S8_9GAMM|nr:hypothetical protein [Marinomonas balearica]TDO96328.1 HrpZ protein [Marinomonas balearica]